MQGIKTWPSRNCQTTDSLLLVLLAIVNLCLRPCTNCQNVKSVTKIKNFKASSNELMSHCSTDDLNHNYLVISNNSKVSRSLYCKYIGACLVMYTTTGVIRVTWYPIAVTNVTFPFFSVISFLLESEWLKINHGYTRTTIAHRSVVPRKKYRNWPLGAIL